MANDKDFKVKNGLDVGSTVTLQAYGQGNNIGTAAKILAVDSSGNLIEEAPSAGGGLANVVEDITPQLGGSLDVNGNSIVSVSDGDIAITPDGAGQIVLDGLNWPISDGTDRQVLVTDGSGELTFDDIPPVQVAATNNTGSSIAAGTPVYQTGVSGQNITIAPADASSASTMPAIGVTKGTISASGGTGVVVVSGFLKGINTSAYTAGDTLFVANGGGFTTSLSNLTGEGNLIENLGKVVKSDASAGSILVTGAGRANATPNLNQGKIFIGNSSNQAVAGSFGTGIDVNASTNEVSIGQAVGTTDNVQFGNATLSGYLAGPATFTIDPAAVGDNTGKVVIAGNLQVDGEQTIVNSTTVEVGDKNIVLGADATADTQNDGAGITVSRPDSTNAGISWDETNDEWDVTNGLNIAGTVTATRLGSVTPTAPTDGQVLTWDNANGYWEPADAAGGGNIQSEEFPTVTAGSANVTMSQSYALTHIEVYLNGVKLRGGTGNDYTVSGTTLTFSENLEAGDVVCIVALENASTFTIDGTFGELTDVSVGSQATNTLIRYNGTNYVPTSLAEDSSGNVSVSGTVSSTGAISSSGDITSTNGSNSVSVRKADVRTTTGTHTLVGGASLYYASANATYNTASLTAGDIVTIYCESGAVTVNTGGSVSLFKDGESSAVSGAVTIAADTIATVTCVSSTKAIITGSGI